MTETTPEYEYVTEAELTLLRGLGQGQVPGVVETILRARINDAIHTAMHEAADRIEAELICCDVFERLGERPTSTWTPEERTEARVHSICYWREAARLIVLGVPKPWFSDDASTALRPGSDSADLAFPPSRSSSEAGS